MYENSVVALHMILESPTTAGDRSIHSSDVSCKISTIPRQITYLENGIQYYCIEVTCDDGSELPAVGFDISYSMSPDLCKEFIQSFLI